jgi:uncharacterized protein (TIGR03086 family)
VDRLDTLDYTLATLRDVIGAIDDAAMEGPTNCDPWTVRRLASHALNNQLLWAGVVTGQELVAVDVAMGAVPIDGDLWGPAAQVSERVGDLWRTAGIFDSVHATPFGELPGSVVVDFAIIDAAAHAWDLSTSVGRPLEFDQAHLADLADVVAATCNDTAIEHGLVKPAAEPPADATGTERLMALSGRAIGRP